MKLSGTTVGWIVAATIHDARGPVDEGSIALLHAIIHPLLQLRDVIPAAGAVGLHGVQPVEHASHPLQLRWAAGIADGVRVLAKVDLRINRGSSLVRGPLAHEEVQLPEVACSRCLDNASAPPAAALQVLTALRLPKQGRIWIWASAIDAALTCELPSSCLDALVVLAAATSIDVVEVLVQGHIVSKGGDMAISIFWRAPWCAVVPPWGLGHLGLGRAEELRRGSIPAGLRVGPHLHVGVDITGHLSASEGVLLWRAAVILIGLMELTTSRRC
mmetsp:Transcript_3732/g.8899  ORF Transcript_3732/g.8899 Transcript_3732/m.8899 type:complete len:273 (-) Transcript_3732:1628-2446(-)